MRASALPHPALDPHWQRLAGHLSAPSVRSQAHGVRYVPAAGPEQHMKPGFPINALRGGEESALIHREAQGEAPKRSSTTDRGSYEHMYAITRSIDGCGACTTAFQGFWPLPASSPPPSSRCRRRHWEEPSTRSRRTRYRTRTIVPCCTAPSKLLLRPVIVQVPEPKLAHLLHALFGLDHYPNYLQRVRSNSKSSMFHRISTHMCCCLPGFCSGGTRRWMSWRRPWSRRCGR